MTRIDLHTHSTASDGTLSPKELVDYAVEKKLSAIALTDHDTIDGLDEAICTAEKYKGTENEIEVIPGIEFSTEYFGRDVHVLGLYIDYQGEYFQSRLKHFVLGREKRNRRMCRKLCEGGMDISYEEMLEEFPDSIITRAHFARMLLKKGYVKSVKEAFDRFIGDGKPFYTPRKRISPFRAIEIIRRAGGFPILAHPVLSGFSRSVLEELVSKCKSCGLMGIECVYSTFEAADERQMRELAAKYDLAPSGGSDFHGANKTDIDLAVGRGKLFIPSDILEVIKEKHKKMLETNDQYRLRKILFTDLDDTLLKYDKSISKFTHDVLKEWVENGHFIALCSGRDISSVNRVKEQLIPDLENVFTIGFNGGVIYDNTVRKTIKRVGLNIDDVEYIRDRAVERGIYIQTYFDDEFIIPEFTEGTRMYTNTIKTPYRISKDIVAPLREAGIEPAKCLIIELEDQEKIDRFVKDMEPWASEHKITMFRSNPYLMEVIPSESGKGEAVKSLCEYLNIPGLIPVAAGDQQNDLSMLLAADIAIAMENGIEELKDVATTISEDTADNDGLAKTILGMM